MELRQAIVGGCVAGIAAAGTLVLCLWLFFWPSRAPKPVPKPPTFQDKMAAEIPALQAIELKDACAKSVGEKLGGGTKVYPGATSTKVSRTEHGFLVSGAENAFVGGRSTRRVGFTCTFTLRGSEAILDDTTISDRR